MKHTLNPRQIHRDLRDAYRAAIDQGWRVSYTGSGHMRWCPPDRQQPAVVTPSSPGRGRAIPNSLAHLRRAGLEF